MEATTEREGTSENGLAVRGDGPGALARVKLDLDDVPSYTDMSTTKYPMGGSGKYWIELKNQLEFGEQTVLDNASVIGVLREQAGQGGDSNQTVRLDMAKQRLLMCAIWLNRWNIPLSPRKKEIALPRNINDRVETIRHLNPDWGDAIAEKIAAHIAERQPVDAETERIADERAGIMPEDVVVMGGAEERDSPPEAIPNGSPVIDAQSSQSSSSPVGVSAG